MEFLRDPQLTWHLDDTWFYHTELNVFLKENGYVCNWQGNDLGAEHGSAALITSGPTPIEMLQLIKAAKPKPIGRESLRGSDDSTNVRNRSNSVSPPSRSRSSSIATVRPTLALTPLQQQLQQSVRKTSPRTGSSDTKGISPRNEISVQGIISRASSNVPAPSRSSMTGISPQKNLDPKELEQKLANLPKSSKVSAVVLVAQNITEGKHLQFTGDYVADSNKKSLTVDKTAIPAIYLMVHGHGEENRRKLQILAREFFHPEYLVKFLNPEVLGIMIHGLTEKYSLLYRMKKD